MPRAARLHVAALLALLVACSDHSTLPSEAARPRASVAAANASDLWATIIDGETGPGTSYRMYMPVAWNGELVVYAHGVVAPFLPPTIPDEADAFAQVFGAQGFAVALSSFKETGLAVADGFRRTHQLSGLFTSQFSRPARTYLAGRSMGGYIVAALAEQFPGQYDGVLPLCGIVGGVGAEISYLFNARALFDELYPGTLPGTLTAVNLPSDPAAALAALADIQNRALAAILTDARPLPGAIQIALIDQTLMPLPNGPPFFGPLDANQFGTFVVTPLLLHATLVNDVVQHTQGHIPFGNDNLTYTSQAPFMAPVLVAINAGVTRVAARPDAVNWIANNGETSGQLTIPMLTLHTRFDTWVPIATEGIYRARVAAAGHSDLLVQRTTNGFDHCNFTAAEVGQGLADLVNWVEHGQKPQP